MKQNFASFGLLCFAR